MRHTARVERREFRRGRAARNPALCCAAGAAGGDAIPCERRGAEGAPGGVRTGGAPALRVAPIALEDAVGWLFALVVGAVPRVGALLLWRARPDRVAAAFGGRRAWPALGVVFLPLTTLLYVFRWRPTGLAGRDWLWLLLALAVDVGQAGRPAATNRNRGPDPTGSTAAP